MMVWIPVFNRFQQRIIHFGNMLRDYPITLCIFLAIQWASSGSVPRLPFAQVGHQRVDLVLSQARRTTSRVSLCVN